MITPQVNKELIIKSKLGSFLEHYYVSMTAEFVGVDSAPADVFNGRRHLSGQKPALTLLMLGCARVEESPGGGNLRTTMQHAPLST